MFIDGIELENPTPATIVQRLNTQKPKELDAEEIVSLRNEK